MDGGDVVMTIAEVSQKFDISADTLRYYERIGLIPPVPRTRGGGTNWRHIWPICRRPWTG